MSRGSVGAIWGDGRRFVGEGGETTSLALDLSYVRYLSHKTRGAGDRGATGYVGRYGVKWAGGVYLDVMYIWMSWVCQLLTFASCAAVNLTSSRQRLQPKSTFLE